MYILCQGVGQNTDSFPNLRFMNSALFYQCH